MTEDDIDAASPHFYKQAGPWVEMGVCAQDLGGAFFLSTGSGKFMRNVLDNPETNIAVLQINDAGDSYRIVWGLCDGANPTSEFPTHFMNHAVRYRATNGTDAECRVIYHAHPTNVIAMSAILP